MNQPFCITFAGAVGSSKTPISHMVSIEFGLPIFNNDAIRSEVKEDLLEFDSEEYLKRRNQRLQKLILSQKSFILDASIDRTWSELKPILDANKFKTIVISLDLSKELLKKLYKAKDYQDSLKRLDQLHQDHEDFLKQHSQDVFLNINDQEFSNRLNITHTSLNDLDLS